MTETAKDPICAAITRLRESLGLTRVEFAAELGVSLRTAQRWEYQKPPDAALFDLARLAEAKKEYDAVEFFRQAYRESYSSGSQLEIFPEAQAVPTAKQLAEAVRELRLSLGKTQTEFAAFMHKSLPTIARWESSAGPKDESSILALYAAARHSGLPQVSATFLSAISEHLAVWRPGSQSSRDTQSVEMTPSEALWVNALLYVLRNPQPANARSNLLKQLSALYKVTLEYQEGAGASVDPDKLDALLRQAPND